MIKLAQLTDGPIAYVLLHELEEASIKASLTRSTPVSHIYTDMPANIEVWIDCEKDLEQARRIHQEVHSRQTKSKCPSCGFDMRGHSGTVKCPECGRPLTTPIDNIKCDDCGEDVPTNFEVCWNCGKELNK